MKLNESVFKKFPIIKTKRLTLRKLTPNDAQEIFQMRSNKRINEFIPRPLMSSFEESKALIDKTENVYRNKQGIAWAGELRENHQIIGTCGFNQIDIPNLHGEIGGEMDTFYWGKTLPLEAVKAIIEFGFSVMNLQTIEAKVSPDNRGAVFILSSLGFVKEAHFSKRIYQNGIFKDMAVYTAFRDN